MSLPYTTLTCPSCWQSFSVPAPAITEVPTTWDYDCEICCRPLLIDFTEDAGDVVAEARSLDDA